jgi:heat-inducible transcriptional repressor
VTPSALQEASNFLNARLRGRTLSEAKDEGGRAGHRPPATGRDAARLVEDGLAAWSGGEGDARR